MEYLIGILVVAGLLWFGYVMYLFSSIIIMEVKRQSKRSS